MKTLLSLYDVTGHWASFFAQNGWNVIQWDIKLGLDVLNLDTVETCLELLDSVDGVIAAPPCTEFTNSGAQYWGIKDEDGRTAQALELVYQVLRIANLFEPTDPEFDGTFFWTFENPAGRLPNLIPQIGKAHYFEPWEFAGHLDLTHADHNELDRIRRKDGKNITLGEVDFVVECNAYTKKTGLWGEFNRNMEKKPVEPVKLCKQGSFTQRLGGPGEQTKAKRSVTPLGFAKAFYQAQLGYSYDPYPVDTQMKFDW